MTNEKALVLVVKAGGAECNCTKQGLSCRLKGKLYRSERAKNRYSVFGFVMTTFFPGRFADKLR